MRWGLRGASALPDRRSARKHTGRGRGRGVRSPGGRGTAIAAPSAWPRVPAAKFAGRTSAVHPEKSDPGEGRERKRWAPPSPPSPSHPGPRPRTGTPAPLPPVCTAPRDSHSARAGLSSAPQTPPFRDGTRRATSRLELEGTCPAERRPVRESRAGGPEEPLTSEKFLGGTRSVAGMRVVQVSRSVRDAHDQPRQTRRPELGAVPGWREGASEGRRGAGTERGRSGAERAESLRPERGRRSTAEAPPSALRCAAPRPSRRPDSSLPGNALRADTSYPGSQLHSGLPSSSADSRAGSADPRPSLSSLLFPAPRVSHHSSF